MLPSSILGRRGPQLLFEKVDPMSELISSESWMKRTAVRGRRRSAMLKEVDRQLQFYEKFPQHPTKLAITDALRQWMESKKPSGSWVANARNHDGAIAELWNELNRGAGIGDEEGAPLELMNAARSKFLVKLFVGTKLSSHSYVESAGKVGIYANALRRGINGVQDQAGSGRAQKLGRDTFTGALYTNAWGRVTESFQGSDFADILNHPEFIADVSS